MRADAKLDQVQPTSTDLRGLQYLSMRMCLRYAFAWPPRYLSLMIFPDAVPKKRGPKTDVLEALLKRVDGLERRLQDEKKPAQPLDEEAVMDDTPVPEAVITKGNAPQSPGAGSSNFSPIEQK